MFLSEQIKQDLKEAMQKQESAKLSVLRMLVSAINNKKIEKKTKLAKDNASENFDTAVKLSDEEVLEVISSETKKRRDSIEQYRKAGRDDLAEQEAQEIKFLEKYLPEQMSEEDIRKKVQEKMEQAGIESPQEIGKLMSLLMPEVKGKADGGIVNKIVKEELGG